ncbi:MAG: family 10 glycosylhydrolase [Dysgonamonadaceae bacterium]|jgi:uncharacterized lipoprotein YddW (UPF0748 family)|nr:family 10 glycosylhydrolase [Dysgonamonadaceae bacterium]
MNKFNWLYITALTLLFAVACNKNDDPDDPSNPDPDEQPSGAIQLQQKELRGVWMATAWRLDWPQEQLTVTAQKKLYTDYLDKFVSIGINAVFVQIRPFADAFYNSQYESWSSAITGVAAKDPGYDVLRFMIDETHARGLEFHAWMNPYRIARRTDKTVPFAALDPKINQSLTKDYDKIRIYNPALPEVQTLIANIVKEVITEYDVDGIHFDDYFYPDPSDYSSLDDAEDFKKYGAGYADIESFRRANVDKAIKNVYDVITTNKPGVVFSVSPTSDNTYNLNSLKADVVKWCEEGWIDVVIPQLYIATGTASSSFNVRLSWWHQYCYKAVYMVGYGLYKFGDAQYGSQFQTVSELAEQFRLARNLSKVQGSIHYSAQYFNLNRLGIIDILRDNIYQNPALIPFAGRKTASDPTPAGGILLSGNTLKWTADAGLRTVIYQVSDNKGTIIAITSDHQFTLPAKGKYCLTTVNADNNESEISEIVELR